MEAICTKPRASLENVRRTAGSIRKAVPVFAALLALGLSGCSIIFPPDGCPSLEDLCPALECPNGFAVNDDGCAMCECAAPTPEPTVCWDDGECADGQRCDVDNFCELPPGCVEGEPCPAVCYGRCVVEPQSCSSDSDCDADERCAFDGGASPGQPTEPAPPPPDEDGSSDRACEPNPDGSCGGSEQDPIIAPGGTCVPASCDAERPVAGCPTGSELVIDFSSDPCGKPVCVDRDECRALDPEICEQVTGCHVEELPTPCGCAAGQDCMPCENQRVCVSDDVLSCEELNDEQCSARSDCELVLDGGAAPCFQECDADGNCTGNCGDDPPAGNRCVNRDPPPPEGDCFSDFDCGPQQFCDIVDECGSSCDPNAPDEPCAEVCLIVGFCTDLPPEPAGCETDDECGLGYLCERTEVCGCSSGDPADPPEGGAPPACQEECTTSGQCVWNPDNTSCFSDSECGAAQTCQYLDGCAVPPDCPNCLIACQGICVDNEPDRTACSSEAQCAQGELCNAAEVCNQNPSCVDGQPCTDECWGYCVAPEPPPGGDKCLEQADCGEGMRCAMEVDSCYCPEGETCDVCYWQCVPEQSPTP